MSISALFNTKYNDIDIVNSTAVTAMVKDMFLTVYGIPASNIPAGFVDWWVEQITSGKIAAQDMVSTSLGFVDSGQFAAAEQANATAIVAAADASRSAATAPGATLESAAASAIQQWTGSSDTIPASGLFTLKEATIARVTQEASDDVLTSPELVTMWGYTPCADCETGYNGAPLEQLINAVDQIIGVSLLEVFSDNTADQDQGITWDLGSVTDLTIGSVGNDGTANVTLTFVDGSKAEAQVAMSAAQQELINSLMFDADGNSRLFQEEMHVLRITADNVDLFTDFGYQIDDVIYSNGPILVREGDVKVTEDFFTPIRLTPSVNNGGTIEFGYTSAGDDIIVAGRLDLLHQAYIDGGAGYNTLEIEAKGAFAQPVQLLNIQHVSIHNLPNIYDYTNWVNDDVSGSTDGSVADGYFDYGRTEGSPPLFIASL